MHKCQFCGYMFESNEMQRISLNLIGRPYNICLGCSEKYKNKDMWDDNKNASEDVAKNIITAIVKGEVFATKITY